jgi:two-component system, chemotaxis family, chemotaxis protein CheY
VHHVDFEPLSFLIVDDSAHMRAIIRTILLGFGCRRFSEAGDGAEGLEHFLHSAPDIIITDWEMPVLSGPEMIRMIRNPNATHNAFVPIILLTAYSERGRMMQAKGFGVHEILRKPVSPAALYQRVRAILLEPREFLRTPSYFGPTPREERVPGRVGAPPGAPANVVAV